MLRLSDKNIEAIRLDAEQCKAPGMGDILLLCGELQERRKNGENVATELLGERLLERFQEGTKLSERLNRHLSAHLAGHKEPEAWELREEVTNTTLVEGLISRIQSGEAVTDHLVLGLFNALRSRGYFQTMIPVTKDALYSVLQYMGHVNDHRLQEMIATRGLATRNLVNPIDQLASDFSASAAPKGEGQ